MTLSENEVIFEVPCFLTSSIRNMLRIGIYVRVTSEKSSLSFSWLGSKTKLVCVPQTKSPYLNEPEHVSLADFTHIQLITLLISNKLDAKQTLLTGHNEYSKY